MIDLLGQICWSIPREERPGDGKNPDRHGICERWRPKHGGEATEGIEAVPARI